MFDTIKDVVNGAESFEAACEELDDMGFVFRIESDSEIRVRLWEGYVKVFQSGNEIKVERD